MFKRLPAHCSSIAMTMYLVSRTETFAKLFFVISFAGLFMYILLAFYSLHSVFFSKHQTKEFQTRIQYLPSLEEIEPFKNIDQQSMKYILLWDINKRGNPLGEGQEPFRKYNCAQQNCYLTVDRELLSDYTEFHAIVFDGTDLKRWNKTQLPLRRSAEQKYVFFSKNASEAVPICNPQADNYFNWTWSYKLYSDIFSPFFEVKDLKGEVVAPSYKVIWSKYDVEPRDYMRTNKTTKTKAMTTVGKYCGSAIGRLMKTLINEMTPFLKELDLEFTVFGCDNRTCDEKCMDNIKKKYFFYWVYEWSFMSEDYVTDDFFVALETNTVPVFTGGMSDYSKFLPPGSYITETVENLPGTLYYAIKNHPIYLNYFQWKKYYTIQRTPYYHGLCQLCSNLNNHVLMEQRSHYEMFRRWWYPGLLQAKCMKRADFDKKPPLQLWKTAYRNHEDDATKIKEKRFGTVQQKYLA